MLAVVVRSLSGDVSSELQPREHEAGSEYHDIRTVSVPREARRAAPVVHYEQDRAQREQLSDLHADVEGKHVRHETVARQVQFLQLRGETEAMEKPEDQHGELGVRLPAEQRAERVHVVERLVDDRQPDDGVDEKWIDVQT